MKTPSIIAFIAFALAITSPIIHVGAADSGLRQNAYYAYVACESEDEVAVVKITSNADGDAAIEVVERIPVGIYDVEIEGPHGLAVSLDGKHWFVSMAHGRPFGTVYKYSTETNEMVGEVELGLFPATMQVSTASGLMHVVNFNLHGDRKPSSVSIVDPDEMIEVSRVTTGVMPHGSRFSPDGKFHYSLAMMSHDLFEIDAIGLDIRRKLKIMPGESGKMAMPTWVQMHPQERFAYVACNGSDEVVEINLDEWKITRRLPTGAGPYNVEVTPDGKHLVVTYKKAAQTGIWEIGSGTEVARIDNSRVVPHGIMITPDSKFALVTVEGKGGEPGGVDLIDLQEMKRVGTAEVGKQAGGIAFWKSEIEE